MKNNKDQIKQLEKMTATRENELKLIDELLREPHGTEKEEELQNDKRKNEEAIERYQAEINRLAKAAEEGKKLEDTIRQFEELTETREKELELINTLLREPHGAAKEEELQEDLVKNKIAIEEYQKKLAILRA